MNAIGGRNLIVLVNPGHDEDVSEEIAKSFGAKSRDIPREDPPISIINLGAFIRDHGYEVVILDTHIERNYKELLKRLISEKPLAIGISVILGKFTKNAITLTKFIKETDAEINVVWGGKLTHLAREKIFHETDVDYIVIGDGELPLLELLNSLKAHEEPKDVAGLGYMKDGKIIIDSRCAMVEDLDEIYQSHDFGWDLIRENVNPRQQPYFMNLYTSRGCRFNCSFCYLKDIDPLKFHLRYRRRSAANVIKEIDYLNSKYGINVFTFGDDDFLCEIDKIVPILNHFRKKNLYIEHIWTNIYNLKPENVELLKGVCQTVCYSIETSSPRLQKILRKIIPTERILGVNKMLRGAGINTVHNFLFGVPTETDEETKQNIDLIKQIKSVNPYSRANCYILSPIPNTPIFEFAKSIARKEVDWNLDDLANFHFRYMGERSFKFRPHLTAEDNHFYERATVLANELFTEINGPVNEKQLKEISSSKRLSFIFGDLSDICCPPDEKKKYILNEVIKSVDGGQPLPIISPF